MNGFIYAIWDGASRVKIGWSSNPVRRLAKLGTDCPMPVRLLGVIAATREQESELHRLLSPWRANREWFHLRGPVAHFVGMLPCPRPRSQALREARNSHPLHLYRHRCGLTLAALADKSGTTKATLSRIETGKLMPGLPLARRLCAATGLPLDVLCQAEPAVEAAR